MENQFYLVEDTSAEIAKLQRERDELDQEVNRLTAKVGDLDLENSTLVEELQQARSKAEELRSQLLAGELPKGTSALPEASDLLNQLKGKLRASKHIFRSKYAVVTRRDITITQQ